MKTKTLSLPLQGIGILAIGLLLSSFQIKNEEDTLKGKYTARAKTVPQIVVHPEEGGPPIFRVDRLLISPYQIIEFNETTLGRSKAKGKFTVQSHFYNQLPGLQTIKKTGKYKLIDQKIYLKYKKVYYYDRIPEGKRYRFWHRFRVVHKLPKHKRISEMDSLVYLNADTLILNKDFYLVKSK